MSTAETEYDYFLFNESHICSPTVWLQMNRVNDLLNTSSSQNGGNNVTVQIIGVRLIVLDIMSFEGLFYSGSSAEFRRTALL